MDHVLTLTRKLSTASVKRYSNPYAEFEWPDHIDESEWLFSPELSSLAGTDVFDSLNEVQLRKLCFWELINFFSLNIHGEKALLQGLTKRLYSDWPAEISDYLHHFVGEENKHMTLFGTFCNRYAKKVYPSKNYQIPGNFSQGEEDFLFFVRVVIFEELVDYYNLSMSRDERLHPLSRAINGYHHNDESRHLAFGRKITKHIFDTYSPQWSEETLANIRRYLADYIVATWKEYYNPWVYKDAQINDAYEVYQMAWDHEAQRALRKMVSRKCLEFLTHSGILKEEPQL
ncbi:MAG: diiron oxygenase [Burkholderiales bacterium]|nr:diiron oxygenase [Burkholderiales bacterium]MDR4517395.1 diiron oxygenase [Nitrosomonas sp.]